MTNITISSAIKACISEALINRYDILAVNTLLKNGVYGISIVTGLKKYGFRVDARNGSVISSDSEPCNEEWLIA